MSRLVDEILNRVPIRSAPYVGSSAFTHKAGLHASAIVKNPKTYEHIQPDLVGKSTVYSNVQSGRYIKPKKTFN